MWYVLDVICEEMGMKREELLKWKGKCLCWLLVCLLVRFWCGLGVVLVFFFRIVIVMKLFFFCLFSVCFVENLCIFFFDWFFVVFWWDIVLYMCFYRDGFFLIWDFVFVLIIVLDLFWKLGRVIIGGIVECSCLNR